MNNGRLIFGSVRPGCSLFVVRRSSILRLKEEKVNYDRRGNENEGTMVNVFFHLKLLYSDGAPVFVVFCAGWGTSKSGESPAHTKVYICHLFHSPVQSWTHNQALLSS